MLKRSICLLIAIILVFSMTSCSVLDIVFGKQVPPEEVPDGSDVTQTPDEPDNEQPENPDQKPDDTKPKPECDGHVDWNHDNICDNCGGEIPVFPDTDKTPTIFLAGDSTVKTYDDGQYIAGWGQFLELFLSDKITVKNAAHGGRSSRSFINEGRLYDIDGGNYSFSQNGGNSIADEIKEGDYLFIQFGHNDDASKLSNYTTIYDRMVPLGEPDANGIYPVTPAEKMPTTYLPPHIPIRQATRRRQPPSALSQSTARNTMPTAAVRLSGI